MDERFVILDRVGNMYHPTRPSSPDFPPWEYELVSLVLAVLLLVFLAFGPSERPKTKKVNPSLPVTTGGRK